MMKRLFISLVLILFILMGMTEVVHVSAGITIDGKFDDWQIARNNLNEFSDAD